MAGIKGKSGGARKGAGRKPKAPAVIDVNENSNKSNHEEIDSDAVEILDATDKSIFEDPKTFLLAVIKHEKIDIEVRVNAAKSLLPFMHPRLGEGGKKANAEKDAKQMTSGRFGASPPPLKSVK